MHVFDFKIPEKVIEPKQLVVELKPAAISKWLDQLPVTNPEQASYLLNSYLDQLIQCKTKPDTLFMAIELIGPVVEGLTETLRTRYMRASLPLTERNERHFQFGMNLNYLLALAYKSIYIQQLENSKRSAENKVLMSSMYKVLRFLSYLVLENYLIYRPVEPNIWQACHALFQLAEQHDLLNIVLQTGPDEQDIDTIEQVYKRIILLSLANPYHLMQEEARNVFRMLEKLAQGISILPFPENETVQNSFAIDLQSDGPPVFISTDRQLTLFQPRILDSNQIIDALQSSLEKLEQGIREHIEQDKATLAERLHRDLLIRLRNSWSRSRERSEGREKSLGKRDIIIGLSTTHYYTSDKIPFRPELDEIKLLAGALLETSEQSLQLVPKEYEPWKTEEAEHRLEAGIDNPRSSVFDTESSALDKWEKVYSVNTSRNTDEIMIADNANVIDDKIMTSSWDLRNVSQKGLSLFCHADRCLPVRVGELISYRSDEKWIMGTIRWLHAYEIKTLEVGIMLVSEKCTPIATRAVSGVGKGGEYMRSLLIDGAQMDDAQAKLMVPAAIYECGTQLVINLQTEIKYVELTEQTLSNTSINIFKFKLIDMPDTETSRIEALLELV